MSAYTELVQITHRFYYYLDEMRYNDLAGLMREDGVWHRQGKVLKGRAQVLAAMHERPATQVIRHVISNAFLEEARDNQATLIAYLTAYRYDDGSAKKLPVTIDGPFSILLVKKRFVHDAGRWLIAESSGARQFEFLKEKQA
jgi:SnoaL-like domain